MTKSRKTSEYAKSVPFPKFNLWDKFKNDRVANAVEFEMTARCNNNCRHCYINLPADDRGAKQSELTLAEIERIADQAVSIGFLWWLLTGGEPFLRSDFFEIYMMLKKKGFLMTIFTNATLVTDEHVKFLKKYPPRDIEVTIYGVSEKVYEKITQVPGSFKGFLEGLERLLGSGLKVHLKAMALRSNFEEFPAIVRFCREQTNGLFRIDPFLHLRYDRDSQRNQLIMAERLSTQEIIEVEQLDPERVTALRQICDKKSPKSIDPTTGMRVINCGAGNNDFTLSYNGQLKLCMPLCHPDYQYDLRTGVLREAWLRFIPQVWHKRIQKKETLERCGVCSIRNLCQWCPAVAFLETGELARHIGSFCDTALSRSDWLKRAQD